MESIVSGPKESFDPLGQILFDGGCFIFFVALRGRLVKSALFGRGSKLSSVLLLHQRTRFGRLSLRQSYLKQFLAYEALSLAGGFGLSTVGWLPFTPVLNCIIFSGVFCIPIAVAMGALMGGILAAYKHTVSQRVQEFL